MLWLIVYKGALVLIFTIRQIIIQIEEVMLALVVVGRDDHVVAILLAQIVVIVFNTHHLMTFELEGLWRAQHGFRNHTLHPVVIVEHQVRLVVVVGQIGSPQLTARPLVGEASLDEQDGPRTGSMAMLIGVAMQEIEQFVERLVTGHGHLLGEARGGDAVDGEHVDIDACYIVAVCALYQGGAAVDNLPEAARVGGRGLDAQGLQRLGQPLMGMHHETVVVRTGHADVHVVVPGDEPLVADGTQHGACPTVVSDVVRLTDTVYRQQDLQNVPMEGFYIV